MKKSQPTDDAHETGLQSFASLCVTAISVLFVYAFIAQNFLIPSASMASTILVGDHDIVDKVSLAPASPQDHILSHILPYRPLRRGEPVVFYKPILESDGSEDTLVKRVVGIPGDRIHLRGGVLYVNGVAQHEPYAAMPSAATYNLYRDDFPLIPPRNVAGVTARWSLELPQHIVGDDLVVPPDSYFMMGDNRTNSLDSRYWGFVKRENLVGRPLFIYWSIDTPEENGEPTLAEQASVFFRHLTHFATDTRWRRTFQIVR
ncbi:MAG: signal peptidase I [Acidobacteriaceae bacterium]|jgi:signal peptidase I